MEAVKKAFFGIFICLLSFLLMSHNVSAADIDFTSEPVTHYQTLTDFTSRWNNYATYVNGTIHTGGYNEINRISFYPAVVDGSLTTGSYYMEIYLRIGPSGSVTNAPQWFGVNYAYYDNGGYPMSFISDEQVSSTTSGNMTYRVYRILFKYAGGTCFNQACSITFGNNSGMFAAESYRIQSVVFWKVKNSDASNSDIINSINNQSQSLTNINNSVNNLNDTIEDRQEEEDEALDNISNQSPEDLQGDTDNQASTNLIGLFQSFVTALTNITQANNCNLTLNFPSYAGGAVTVNVCQYKDKGGNIVAIFSSLTLIIFYIPLALKLLSIIYNEIRSFTNG